MDNIFKNIFFFEKQITLKKQYYLENNYLKIVLIKLLKKKFYEDDFDQ
jgi:hypothetical protein